MAGGVGTDPRERAASGLLSALLVAGLGWALVAGLGVRLPVRAEETLAAFDVLPSPPPPRERVTPPTVRSKRPEGRAAPPNIRSQATQVVAPVPIVPIPRPPPVITVAPVAHVGADPTAGAADRSGPGTGAGGEGDGFGGGGRGDGDGGGWEDLTPPRWRRGSLGNVVLPEALRYADGLYAVEMRFFVEPDGRVTRCRVVESSGWPELDRNACAGMERRVRYHPARDPEGRAVRSSVISRQEWLVEAEPGTARAR